MISHLDCYNLKLDSILADYPPFCIPHKLKKASGSKAKELDIENFDINKYDKGANMVAFAVQRNRIHIWIKALHVYYYKHLGSRDDLDIDWYDDPKEWKRDTPIKAICVDVKQGDNLCYKVTIFVTTGTLQVQGKKFANFVSDFQKLKYLVGKIDGENASIEIMITSNNNAVDDHNDILESQATVANDNNPIHELDDTVMETEQKVPQGLQTPIPPTITNLETPQTLLKVNTYTSPSHVNMNRLNQSLVGAITKGFASFENKISTLSDSITSNVSSKLDLMAKSNAQQEQSQAVNTEISQLKSKFKKAEEEKEQMRRKYQTEISNSTLEIEHLSHTIKVEKQLTKETEMKLFSTVSQLHTEIDNLNDRLNKKNEEVSQLEVRLQDTKCALGQAQDEIMSLKLHNSRKDDSLIHVHEKPAAPQTPDASNSTTSRKPRQPNVLIVGTSNIRDIKEDKLTREATVSKKISMTLQATKECIMNEQSKPDMVLLHSLTNDIKDREPQQCVNDITEIAELAQNRWPNVKVGISLCTPRLDNELTHTNGQIVNLMLKKNLSKRRNIYLNENSNMTWNGRPDEYLLQSDLYHLNQNGVSILARNMKYTIHSALGLRSPRGPSWPSQGSPQSTRGNQWPSQWPPQ